MDFPGGSDSKESACNGDLGLIPGSGRSGEGNDYSFQCSCLENPMDRGAWWATVHGVTKESDMTEQLAHVQHKAHFTFYFYFKIYRNVLK